MKRGIKSKQGQVAMEFLMTYGWAIIIILLAIAALWLLGVFSPSVTTSCQIEAPFTCQDAVVADNSVILRLGANQVQSATINSITINGQTCPNLLNTQLQNNIIQTVKCVGLNFEKDEKIVVEVDATYQKSGGGLVHTVEGAVSGQADVGHYVYSGDSALVASYDLDDDLKDYSGNSNDGSIVNGADCSVDGKIGNACHFTLADSEYVLVPDDSSLAFTSAMTIEAWVNPDVWVDGMSLVSKMNDWDAGNVFIMDTGCCGIPQFRLTISDGVIRKHISSNLQLPTGTWTHIAVTWDPTNTIFYVNGVGTTVASPVGVSTLVSNNAPLLIGAGTGTGPAIGAPFYDGSMDQVAIYNRVLSADEIKEHATI